MSQPLTWEVHPNHRGFSTASSDETSQSQRRIRALLMSRDRSVFHALDESLSAIDSQKFELDWVSDPSYARTAILDTRYDIFLLDYRFGEHHGRKERLKRLTEIVSKGTSAPIVLISSQKHFRITLRALHAGAVDYIFKDELRTPALERVIRYTVANRVHERGRVLRNPLRSRLQWNTNSPKSFPFPEARDMIINTIPHAIYWKNTDGVYLGCNNLYAQILGRLHPKSITGKRDIQLPWRDRRTVEQIEAIDTEAITQNQSKYHVIEVDLPGDGRHVWYGVHVVPFHDEDGHVLGVLGTLEDITEHKRVELALRESEARLRLMLEQVPATVWIVNRDFHLNPCSGSWLPSMPKQNRGGQKLSLYEVFETDDPDCTPIAMTRRALSGEAVNYEFSRDGKQFQVNMVPLKEPCGQTIGAIGVTLDVTERHKLETQMRESHKLESLGVLARGIAHDFNNLLLSIVGNAGLAALDIPAESDARMRMEKVTHAAQRASDLTQQLLEYSGNDSGVRESLALNSIVEEMCTLLESAITKHASFEIKLGDRIPDIEADPTQVRQIVMNLITNASDAIGNTPGTIRITSGFQKAGPEFFSCEHTAISQGPGDYVYLQVTDTGKGMNLNTRRKIFDPFYTTKANGRGLGLATVLGLVRSHRGAIKVSSTPGIGSSFKVFFPIKGTSESSAKLVQPAS